jgi:hypothetical protein
VVRGEYVDPDEMISIDSDGVEDMAAFRSESCRIPRIDNPNGLEQLMNKKEMAKNGISSPNMFDSVMMCMFMPSIKKKRKAINYPKTSIA